MWEADLGLDGQQVRVYLRLYTVQVASGRGPSACISIALSGPLWDPCQTLCLAIRLPHITPAPS